MKKYRKSSSVLLLPVIFMYATYRDICVIAIHSCKFEFVKGDLTVLTAWSLRVLLISMKFLNYVILFSISVFLLCNLFFEITGPPVFQSHEKFFSNNQSIFNDFHNSKSISIQKIIDLRCFSILIVLCFLSLGVKIVQLNKWLSNSVLQRVSYSHFSESSLYCVNFV